MEEVAQVFRGYGLTREQIAPVVHALSEHPKAWVDFMMRFELGLEEPKPERARTSALTIGGAYIAGGFIPLAPYMFISTAHVALLVSIAVTLAALFIFWLRQGSIHNGEADSKRAGDPASGKPCRRRHLLIARAIRAT